MDLLSLSLLGVSVVGLGAAATILLTKWVPQPVAELAAEHGRFVGLGETVSTQAPAAAAAPYRAHVQQEAMNVVRTSN
ncbi:hypothetical protein [Paraburkholderia megapolitana]|uniref:Uncharacterized protein n=1 Tax=Paraburkholderia megapolitana TaxID=420953 RepID=A0A1I3EIR7_9BURK|nr:hypothetical protein [Paraburkholderia megapolitana]QDQ80107.1 hypothetical protein FNZ07_02390 [Paraburkholderia megapolitana]SFH98837.1 hypothetical protein SAMN05192543_101900 [Paraburkholderia megapolitana]